MISRAASGANIAAFNIGNALGAWLGGLGLGAGLGFVSPLWIGAAITAAGLIVLLGGSLRPRRRVLRSVPDRAETAPVAPHGSGEPR
ncbi:hypothetical protein [Nonomuraea insulae]|uniref:MFS transporter n=1 Tax=Nonomuraea insulae TaxID=1616787 RepID=A0ABW1CKI0_9ACTN